MKILAKIKKSSLIIGILFAMLLIGIVYAATSYQVNSGAQVTIDEWSVCKKVTNNNALAIFVPTNTAAEWTAFRTNASGVTYAECCSANGVACSSDANCCSAICGTNADGDGYFSEAAGHTGICQATSKPYTDCCDSDNRTNPGQTSYFSTKDNCNSWDYNCNGVDNKYAYDCAKVTSCTVSNDGPELCAETARTLTIGGTSYYYACGAAAINSCKWTWIRYTSCKYYPYTYARGLRSLTVSNTTTDRIGHLCTIPPEPKQDPDNPYCTCR